ncbi:hypothetical protein CD134_05235 [Staphylococcus lutrae]|uniref:Uncharacterized protein n=1 Tax=Staphylococcus lutrae TaxID=155085 RepID=A0AAC9RV22_9STAP|nr:hypothetical protein B5P37_09040 [Staphylococcus lutrae]PNZ37968.1 hypothetical protein CD134_05235 [Staphylococcus lutrae]
MSMLDIMQFVKASMCGLDLEVSKTTSFSKMKLSFFIVNSLFLLCVRRKANGEGPYWRLSNVSKPPMSMDDFDT